MSQSIDMTPHTRPRASRRSPPLPWTPSCVTIWSASRRFGELVVGCCGATVADCVLKAKSSAAHLSGVSMSTHPAVCSLPAPPCPLQQPSRSAPLLGPHRARPAHQDDWPPRKDRGHWQEEVSSPVAVAVRQRQPPQLERPAQQLGTTGRLQRSTDCTLWMLCNAPHAASIEMEAGLVPALLKLQAAGRCELQAGRCMLCKRNWTVRACRRVSVTGLVLLRPHSNLLGVRAARMGMRATMSGVKKCSKRTWQGACRLTVELGEKSASGRRTARD